MATDPENGDIPERRLKPRCKCDYPARVRGQDENGKSYQADGRAINLSRNGVYLIVNRDIPKGMELSIRIALPTGSLELGTSKLVLRGTVVRGEFHSETTYGKAIKFDGYRFL
jgi:hypothetical protein